MSPSECDSSHRQDDVYQCIEDCYKNNELLQENIDRIQIDVDQAISREMQLKRKFDEQMIQTKKEASCLAELIKEKYDNRLAQLRDNHQKELRKIIDKHNSEIQKWHSKYEKLKFNKKMDQSDADGLNDKFLQSKLRPLKNELESVKSQNANLELELNKLKREKASMQDTLKELKKENHRLKDEITTKDQELVVQKKNINDLETKLDKKEQIIDSQNETIESQRDQISSFEKRAKQSKSGILSDPDDVQYSYKEDLTIVKVELRATKKELEKKKEVCDCLRLQLTEAKEKISEYEQLIKKDRDSCNKHLQELELYKNQVNDCQSTIESRNSDMVKLQFLFDEKSKDLNLKLKELINMKANEKKLKEKCAENENKLKSLIERYEENKKMNAALKLELKTINEEKEKLIDEKLKLNKSYDMVKKISKELESDMAKYGQKVTEVSSTNKSLAKQKSTYIEEMHKLRIELKCAEEEKMQVIEENNKLLEELNKKNDEMEKKISAEKILYKELMLQYEIEQNKCKRLEDTIELLGKTIGEREKQLVQLTNEHNLVLNDLLLIKEEASQHITTISMLKIEKQQLIEKLEYQYKQVELLNDQLEIKKEEIKRDHFIFNETQSQQMKLIELLTTKTPQQSSKKKNLLLQINSKQEDGSLEQKLQDLMKQLIEEKTKNADLNAQIQVLNKEYDKQFKEIEQMRADLYEINPNKLPDKQHNWEYFKIIFSKTCVGCAKMIYLGQKAKRCSACLSIVHQDCNLLNNCCISLDTIRQRALQKSENLSSINGSSIISNESE